MKYYTFCLDIPTRPFSFVSTLVQEKNSVPNKCIDDHSLINQHFASRTKNGSI